MYAYLYKDCPLGPLWILSDGKAICAIHPAKGNVSEREHPDDLCRRCGAQLREYFAGERKTFDLPMKLQGTDFQVKVWKTLLQVPYGSTVTYGDLAAMAGYPRAARAVGSAMRNNPLWLLIPCHRVVGASGLGGYGGPEGLPIKRQLLLLEGAISPREKA